MAKHVDKERTLAVLRGEIEAYNQLRSETKFGDSSFDILMEFREEITEFRSFLRDLYAKENRLCYFTDVLCPLSSIRSGDN